MISKIFKNLLIFYFIIFLYLILISSKYVVKCITQNNLYHITVKSV